MLDIQNTYTLKLMVDSIELPTHIKGDGTLQTGCVLKMRAANVDVNEVWIPVGELQTIRIEDILALPSDLSALQTDVNAIMLQVVTLIGQINAIRKAV